MKLERKNYKYIFHCLIFPKHLHLPIMRLLFLTSRLPYPPHRGDRLRVYHFLRKLSKEHQITLISFISNEKERNHIKSLREFCVDISVVKVGPTKSAFNVGLNYWRKLPLQTLYYCSREMQKMVDETLSKNNFDAIYVHLFRMVPYIETGTTLYRIVDLTDIISQELVHSMPYRGFFSRMLYNVERPRIEKYEKHVANHFEEVWLISEYDRAVLLEKSPNANIKVVRNGVDSSIFFPTNEQKTPSSLIFVGHMGVFHNVDAAIYLVNEIFPLIQLKIPDAIIRIVGASPSLKVQRLNEIPGVEVMGFVPDLNKILNRSSVFVAPLRFSAGVQNKVLEAMAAGCPVVTTTLVNQGLGARSGHELILGDDAPSLANAIIGLLEDEVQRHQIGKSGRAFVKANYRWDMVCEQMEVIQKTIH